MRTKEILRQLTRRKRGRLNDGGTTDTPSSEDTPSAENDISAEEDPISESAEDTSEPQGPVEIVWPTFNRPCRVYSGVIPCAPDPMVRRTLCERIKITVGGGGGGGGGSGGGGHRQQQQQQQQQQGQYSGPATTTSRPTKVFFLHKRLLCEYSEYFSIALSPRNRDVFIEAETGHFVFDDDDVNDPDDFYRWAVWLYVCSGCKLSPVYEFQHDHWCRPSRLEKSSESASESSESAAREGEGKGEYLYETYGPYGLPQPPPCMSLSDHIEVGCHHWHRRFDVIAEEEEEEEEGDDARHGGGPEDEDLLRGNCYGDGRSLSSTVTGWFCARDSSSSSSGTGQGSNGVTSSENSANTVISDPNAPLEAAAAYMFGYRILSREYRLFALAHFIQHVDQLTDGYKDELRNLLYEVFPVGSEAHRFLSAWVAWLRFDKRLPLNDDRFDPSVVENYEEGDLETAAFWKMFDRVRNRAGSADPRRYPLFHWEQDCSKELPGHVDCVHIQSLKWHGSPGVVTGSIAPNPVTNTMIGQSSTRSLTAEERWDIFFRLSKAVILFWAYVLWWLAPVLILFFAADSFAQDTVHHLIELYGKILGIVFAVQAPLAAWYRYLGWEWLIGLTMLLGIPKACGSFLWAKHCFDKAHGEVDVKTRPCREEVGLGVFELLFVASLFWVLLTTKHDVHPSVANPEKASWGCRAARPGRESFVRRGLQASWKHISAYGLNLNDGDGTGDLG